MASDSITDVQGIEVGHAEDLRAMTGCTVILARQGAVVGVDVRGPAPATRETDLCRPGTRVERAHAILLAGGSAFGLDAATGVMRFLREHQIGFDTGVARVPIVPGAALFDLGIGEAAWPDAAMGYRACALASDGEVAQGCVGAGTGATVGKLLGIAQATKAGLGTSSVRLDGVNVGALVAVNAFGDVVAPGTNQIVAGARDPETGAFLDTVRALGQGARVRRPQTNTTIGVVATDASLNPEQTAHLAAIAQNGVARTVRPAHTMLDGDTLFALSTGQQERVGLGELLSLASATVDVVERAILRAVQNARAMGGLPAMP